MFHGHDDIAKEIIPATGCYSVVVPREEIEFSVAAVFWPAVYHLMLKENDKKMSHASLRQNLRKVAALFDADIGYYSRSKKLPRGYTGDILRKSPSK